MTPDATLSLGLDTTLADRSLSSFFSRAERAGAKAGKALRPLGEGLSAATANASEFDKSLTAANARVLAFGASAGLIIKVQQGFAALVKTTIDVEKRLKDINVVLGTDSKSLAKFGDSLFKIAKQTGQSFDVVAEAATELSRQGLSIEKTLQRAKDAMILTRLSGLDAASSVEALTASLNTFNEVGIDSTVIINKLAKVDAAFAVSSADLAEALKRVGASAQGAGVNLDELLAIVTAAQQKTARGGSVIGNSFKTIFTRIQRPEVLNQLEELGVAVRTVSGETLPAIRILKSLADTYDKLGPAQKSLVSEQVAGVFQINILKSALSDLNSEFSIYNQAVLQSATATNEAILRNEALNETMAALLNKTVESSKNFAAAVGNVSLAPTIKTILSQVNTILESRTLSDNSEEAGASIGSGLLRGLGKFIGGPGLAAVSIIGGKLFYGFAKFTRDALKSFLGSNSAAAKQKQIQEGVLNTLMRQPGVLRAVVRGQMSVEQVAQQYLATINAENAALQRQVNLADQVGAVLYRGGARMGKNAVGQPTIKGGTPSFSLAHTPKSAGGGGVIPNFAQSEDEKVLNALNSKRKSGEPNLTAARNILSGLTFGNFTATHKAQLQAFVNKVEGKKINDKATAVANAPKPLNSPATMLLPYSRQGSVEKVLPSTNFNYNKENYKGLKLPIAGFDPQKVAKSNDPMFDRDYVLANISNSVADMTQKYAKAFSPLTSTSNVPSKESILEGFKTGKMQDSFGKIYPIKGLGGIVSAAGNAFDAASTIALQLQSEDRAGKGGDFDVRGPAAFSKLRELFSLAPNTAGWSLADFKFTDDPNQHGEMARKIIAELSVNKRALPNFSALSEAIAREKAAGIPSSAIRIGKSASLVNSANPSGLAVYNTIDEPRGLSQGINRYKSAGLNPMMAGMPNFANKVYSSSPSGQPFGLNIGQLVEQHMKQAGMRPSPMRVTKVLKPAQAYMAPSPQETAMRVSAANLKGRGSYWPPSMPVNPATARPMLAAHLRNINNPTMSVPMPSSMRVNPATASGSVSTSNFDKHANNVIRRLIKGEVALDKANKSIEELAKFYGVSKRKQQRQLDRLMKTDSAIGRMREAQLKKHRELEKGAKSPLSMGRLAVAGFAAQQAASIFASANPNNPYATGAESFIQGATTGGAIGSVIPGPWGAIGGAVIGGGLGLYGEISNRKSLALERERQTREDEIAKLNTFMGVYAEGDTAKIAEEFNRLPDSIKKAIGGVDKLSEETLAAAQNMAKTGAVLATFENTFAQASRSTAWETTVGTLMNSFGGIITNSEDYKASIKAAQDQRKADAGSAFIKQIMASGFGNKPLAASLSDQDIQTLITGGDISGIARNIIEQNNVPQSQVGGLISALTQMKDVSKLARISSSDIYSQVGIYREFASKKAEDEAKARDLSATLLQLQLQSAGYSEAGLNLTRGGSGARIYSGKYGALPASTSKYLGASFVGGGKNLTTSGRQGVSEVFSSLQDIARSSSDGNMLEISELVKSGKYKEAVTILGRINADTPEALQNIEQVRLKLLQIEQENTVGGILGRNFRFDAQDQFDFLLDRTDKVSAAMKSSFGDAFNSFVTGAESASDAFRNFALSIANNLSRLATDYVTNQLFGLMGQAGSSLFSSIGGGGSKSYSLSGFATTRKARGGMVYGGSGTRDDVPALLTGGEYVIRKSAVDSLGVGFLDNINRYADGGLVLDNQFNVGTGKNRGSFNVSKRLSYFALTDTNNPQNALRNDLSEQDLARIQSIQDYEDNKNAAMSAYRKRKRQALIGGYIQAGAAIAMGAIQAGINNKHMDALGSSLQNPRLYDMEGPQTRAAYRAEMKGYQVQKPFYMYKQYGGSATGMSPIKPLSTPMQNSASSDMLIAAINNLSLSMAAKSSSGGDVRIQEAGNQTNNINITVNVSEGGKVDATVDNSPTSSSQSDKNNQDRRQEKDLGMMIKNVVVQTITEQKRPGGLLSKAS